MEHRESPIFEQPSIDRLAFGHIRFRSNGLQIDVQKNDLSMSFQDRRTGQKLRVIKGLMVGTLDFTPFGPTLIEGKRYISLAKFIRGLNDFFAHFNDPSYEKFPRYLVGGVGLTGASPEITKFLERSFGFMVDDNGERLAVVGNSRDVKDRLDRLNSNPELIKKIIGMAEVEQTH